MCNSTARLLATGLVVLTASMAGLPPLVPVGTVVANVAIVTTCDEASFDDALATVQLTGGGAITFDCGGTIILTGQKEIASGVTIIGRGAIIIDGNNSTRLFQVNIGAALELNGVTLQNGNSQKSSAWAIINSGTLNITSSTISGISTSDNGAILNGGALTITSSTISDNRGGNGGAIVNSGTLTVIHSTFRDNSAVDYNAGEAIINSIGTLMVSASGPSRNSGGRS